MFNETTGGFFVVYEKLVCVYCLYYYVIINQSVWLAQEIIFSVLLSPTELVSLLEYLATKRQIFVSRVGAYQNRAQMTDIGLIFIRLRERQLHINANVAPDVLNVNIACFAKFVEESDNISILYDTGLRISMLYSQRCP